ncbi:hypothetical protein BDZ89DRAFT_506045 [Hymenopellis radicata]|nr:hypothetical protein BDZ89DRAFT_506045 [Hymenopellis radicata]
MADAFETKFKSIDDLLNDTSAELRIDPSRLAEPLFPAMGPGGRAFQEPLKPATTGSLSQTCISLAKDAGLPAVGPQAFRRDTANFLAVMKGVSEAQMACKHGETSVFSVHYSKGTRNMNPVETRLGEDQPGVLRCSLTQSATSGCGTSVDGSFVN